MKTVVQVVQHLQPGGIEVMALELLRLRANDTRAFIISLEGEKASALARWPRLIPFQEKLFFLNKPAGRDLATTAKLIKDLLSLLHMLKPNAIHTHHIGPLLYGGLTTRLYQIVNPKIRLIHTEHDAWHLENSKRRRLERACVNLFKPQIVADSQSVKDALNTYLPKIDTKLIVNGIDTEKFVSGNRYNARRTLKLPIDKKIIGCAARLEAEKGHTILLKAICNLASDTVVALAGNGSQMHVLKAYAKALKISDRVIFLGQVEDMVSFYQSIDVFCLPSFNEGMPLSPLEAQSCNKPCVLTNVGGCSEALCPHTGQLVDAGNPKAMAQALSIALAKPATIQPRRFVEQSASATAMSSAYGQLAFC